MERLGYVNINILNVILDHDNIKTTFYLSKIIIFLLCFIGIVWKHTLKYLLYINSLKVQFLQQKCSKWKQKEEKELQDFPATRWLIKKKVFPKPKIFFSIINFPPVKQWLSHSRPAPCWSIQFPGTGCLVSLVGYHMISINPVWSLSPWCWDIARWQGSVFSPSSANQTGCQWLFLHAWLCQGHQNCPQITDWYRFMWKRMHKAK